MSKNVTRADDSQFDEGYIYALVTLSVVTGVVLATHGIVIDVQLLGYLLPLVVVIVIGGPIVTGYNGNSFLAGMVIGILPPAGAYASIFAWPPLDAKVIESMVAAALHGTALALPIPRFCLSSVSPCGVMEPSSTGTASLPSGWLSGLSSASLSSGFSISDYWRSMATSSPHRRDCTVRMADTWTGDEVNHR